MKIFKRSLLGLVACVCLILMAGGVRFFIDRPRKFHINIFSEAPLGCDVGMSRQLRGLFSWGIFLDGGLEMKCGEREVVDEHLSISCHCSERRKQGSQ